MNPFKTQKNLQECWQTSDGQCFYTDNAAKNHAKTLEDKSVKHLTRDKYPDTDENPEASKTENTETNTENGSNEDDEAQNDAPETSETDKTENTETNTETGSNEEDTAQNDAPETTDGEDQELEANSQSPAAPKYTEAELNAMKRFQLDAIAVNLGFDPSELPNRKAVVAAIVEFQSK